MTGADINALLRSMRLPFLVLTPVSVLLGASVVVAEGAAWQLHDLLLAMFGGVLAHISVNTLNEYDDFHSGLDHHTRRTPFSGGSGALIDRPQAESLVRSAGLVSLAATVLVGLYFVQRWGSALIPIGAAGVILIVTYTQWLNRWPLACLIAPGLAFGPLMVMGTQFALTGHFSERAALVSLVPLFLASNLLLLNQLPDIEADRRVGRRHLPIVYGVRLSVIVYALFAAATGLTVVAGMSFGLLPLASLAALLPLLGAAVAGRQIWRHGHQTERITPALGGNVVVTLLTPATLALTLALV